VSARGKPSCGSSQVRPEAKPSHHFPGNLELFLHSALGKAEVIPDQFSSKGTCMNSNQATFTVMAALCSFGFGQSPPATILTIEMEKVGRYNENFATPQRNGTSTTMEA